MSYLDDLNGQIFSLNIQQSNISNEIDVLNRRRDEVQCLKDNSANCVEDNSHVLNRNKRRK